MKKVKTYCFVTMALIFFCGFIALGIKNETPKISLITKRKIFRANNKIQLQFSTNSTEKILMYCHSAYGTTIVEPTKKDTLLFFELPKHIAQKKGIVNYELFFNNKTLYKGNIEILSTTSKKLKLESYVGPPSIVAGGKDFTMIVVIPSDFYDNPLEDNNALTIKYNFLGDERNIIEKTKDLIAWKKFFSPLKSGRMFTSSKIYNVPSKEFTVEVYPSTATKFEIEYNRTHKYADGNQIVEFKTNEIKDAYNNTVSNGTIVNFLIQNQEGTQLQTQGSTNNGIARASILHPDKESTWTAQAFVYGVATSNTISLSFKPIVKDFLVEFKENNRKIKVGPLLSYMNQLIPDGAMVQINIHKNNTLIETLRTTSRLGYAEFKLIKDQYPKGNYSFEIKAFGITKNYNKVLQ